MEKVTLLNGDCLDLLQNIPDKSIDFILTDLPYGTTACKWDSIIPFEPMWDQLNRVIKSNGAIALFGSEPFSSLLRMSNLKNYKYDWVWDKVIGTGFLNSKKQPMRCYENISVFYKNQCTYNPQKSTGNKRKSSYKKNDKTEVYGKQNKSVVYDSTERYPRNIQVFSRDTQKSCYHPTQKPVALLEFLIKTYTNENETVLDFTMGSGSTGVACLNTNRNFIGIEKEEKYFLISKDRINKCMESEIN